MGWLLLMKISKFLLLLKINKKNNGQQFHSYKKKLKQPFKTKLQYTSKSMFIFLKYK